MFVNAATIMLIEKSNATNQLLLRESALAGRGACKVPMGRASSAQPHARVRATPQTAYIPGELSQTATPLPATSLLYHHTRAEVDRKWITDSHQCCSELKHSCPNWLRKPQPEAESGFMAVKQQVRLNKVDELRGPWVSEDVWLSDSYVGAERLSSDVERSHHSACGLRTKPSLSSEGNGSGNWQGSSLLEHDYSKPASVQKIVLPPCSTVVSTKGDVVTDCRSYPTAFSGLASTRLLKYGFRTSNSQQPQQPQSSPLLMNTITPEYSNHHNHHDYSSGKNGKPCAACLVAMDGPGACSKDCLDFECLLGDTVRQLHVAVMRGFIEVVYRITRLLPHQAFLDLANNFGRTALHLAVSAGVPAIARHLIVCGASPVARDLRGNTPLHVACARKDPTMVTQLTRPVTVAEVARAQLSYGPSHTPGLLAADLNNYQGETCVHVAAIAGDKEILQHLTLYGADVNAKECRSGRTALHLAVEARDPTLVAHIVTNCRASVTAETYARLSPYQLALANGATGIATQLLGLGAPAQLLPAAFTHDDDEDDDDYDDEIDFSQVSESVSVMNGWQEVDDIRLAGVPVRGALSAPIPVSTAPHTINADLYF